MSAAWIHAGAATAPNPHQLFGWRGGIKYNISRFTGDGKLSSNVTRDENREKLLEEIDKLDEIQYGKIQGRKFRTVEYF